jgi:hypothetical protein
LTWICGLTENYYKIHFKLLFHNFLDLSFTPLERDLLVRQIVDFSAAQREGILGAYMEVFDVGNKVQALKIIKGCHEHFRAQVTRVKLNQEIILSHEEVSGCGDAHYDSNDEDTCLLFFSKDNLSISLRWTLAKVHT